MALELEENQKCLGDEGLLEDMSCKEMTCRVLVSTEPDSVRAWMVCAGAFIGNFIALGTIYSFGVLLVPITLDFKVGRGAAAWIGSVCAASMLFFAIFAGYLCQRFGYSQVAWAGGLTVAVFQIISSFMPNIYGMFVTYGLLTGIGFSCCFMPGSAATSQWFEKYRGLGVGMAVAGSGVGNLVFPLIIETLLLELADWRRVMRCLV
ncbi:MAG: MFS transporter [archaeon]|nr:MFS transporter [archaeon]